MYPPRDLGHEVTRKYPRVTTNYYGVLNASILALGRGDVCREYRVETPVKSIALS